MNIADKIYFPELDGLRFFAFLIVFIHHSSLSDSIPCISFLHTNGWIGVDLFFVLSSFLFTKLLIAEYDKNQTINFKKFYIRRVFRIWPVYFLFVLFSIALYFFTHKEAFPEQVVIRIIGFFTFSDNIMTAIYGYNTLPYTAHLWTIAYEEQFYFFIPIIILLLVQSSLKVKIIFTLLTLALLNGIRFLLIANNIPHPVIWVLPITHFESIIMGIVIGFGGFDSLAKRIKPLIFATVGMLSFVLVCLLPNLHHISYWLIASYSLVGLSTSMILISILTSNIFKKILSFKLLIFLGKRSYGLYVYHLLGNGIAVYVTKYVTLLPSNSMYLFLYSLAFTIAMSIVSYEILETPFLKLKKRFEVIASRPV